MGKFYSWLVLTGLGTIGLTLCGASLPLALLLSGFFSFGLVNDLFSPPHAHSHFHHVPSHPTPTPIIVVQQPSPIPRVVVNQQLPNVVPVPPPPAPSPSILNQFGSNKPGPTLVKQQFHPATPAAIPAIPANQPPTSSNNSGPKLVAQRFIPKPP